MDQIPIGQQITKTLKFRKPYPVFSSAPEWDMADNDGTVVLSGTAIISTSDSNAWDVIFTIPTNYQITEHNTTLTLEVYGTDISGKIRSVESIFELIDSADDFLPSVILATDDEPIEDSLILPFSNIDPTDISVTIQDYMGLLIAKDVKPILSDVFRVANKSDIPDRFTEHEFRGYRYDLELPAVRFPALTRAPYQIIYKIASTTPKLKLKEMHPVLRMSPRLLDFTLSTKMYLDQARLIDVDPTLQWREEEIALCVLDGINHINSHPTVFTFWTVDDIPLPMKSVVEKAAAFYALNKRYLAEGANAFEFQGLTTSLSMDKREAFTYKIEEVKAYLDTNLTLIKANAISTFGKGIPDASITTKESRVILRTQPSPVHARYGYSGTYGSASIIRSSRYK